MVDNFEKIIMKKSVLLKLACLLIEIAVLVNDVAQRPHVLVNLEILITILQLFNLDKTFLSNYQICKHTFNAKAFSCPTKHP